MVPVGCSLGHAQVSWAVGRCRLSAGAPVVREMAVRDMKGREMKFREMKFLHLLCLQHNHYQVMMLRKHDYNDMSKKRIRKHVIVNNHKMRRERDVAFLFF